MKKEKIEKIKKMILISTLIISLTVYNFPVSLVLAEGEEILPGPAPAEEQTAAITESAPDSAIQTGDANATVDMENAVNTNVAGSGFDQQNYDIYGTSSDDINLSDNFATSSCPNCIPEDFNATFTNQGTIENTVGAEASTGDNSIIGGNASITTGDANVAVNIINFLNTNIVGSNWKKIIINIFGDWFGNLVLPTAEKIQGFFDPSNSCVSCGQFSVTSTNSGQIINNVSVIADTGGNALSGSGQIITGDSSAQANILNLANTNIIGGNWFFFDINTFGNWTGDVFGLPDGFSMSSDAAGVQIFNFGDSGTEGAINFGGMNIQTDNTGTIINNINVRAFTGGNSVDGSGTISTGNANASINLINILNSNIFGSNWLLAMINVFGSWTGNLSFGQPDLWIAESAYVETGNTYAFPGDYVVYTIDYVNNGITEATNATIVDDFSDQYLAVVDAGGGTLTGPGEITWNLGTIPVGRSGQVSYRALAKTDMPFGVNYSVNNSRIQSHEQDRNTEDNFDTITVEIYRAKYFPINPAQTSESPYMIIAKTNSVIGPTTAPNKINYEIKLFNDSKAYVYDVIVEDSFYDQDMNLISTSTWNLGKVLPSEEITIKYTTDIKSGAKAGTYTNFAVASGYDKQGNLIYSNKAFTTIEIVKNVFAQTNPFGSINDRLNEILAQTETVQREMSKLISKKNPPASLAVAENIAPGQQPPAEQDALLLPIVEQVALPLPAIDSTDTDFRQFLLASLIDYAKLKISDAWDIYGFWFILLAAVLLLQIWEKRIKAQRNIGR